MAVPKRKKSKSRSKIREKQNMKFRINHHSICFNCKFVNFFHKICDNCGYYRGEKILDFKLKKNID